MYISPQHSTRLRSSQRHIALHGDNARSAAYYLDSALEKKFHTRAFPIGRRITQLCLYKELKGGLSYFYRLIEDSISEPR